MPNRLNEIKARWAAATPGPWGWRRNNEIRHDFGEDARPRFGDLVLGLTSDEDGYWEIATNEADGEAIAAAPEDIRWLVERVERLESVLLSVDELAECAGSAPQREIKRLIEEVFSEEAPQC